MAKRQLPLVSIIIPAFNAAQYMNEAIDSILGQNYRNIELIVLDDGSTDDTAKIIMKHAAKLYWETHPNMGQANTLNKGWQMAKGEVFAYLSADDALLPNAVSTSIRYLLKHKDIVLTYCDYYLMDSDSRVFRKIHTPEFNYRDMVVKINCPPGPGAFFRIEAFLKAGLWNPRLQQTPDYDYWIRLGLEGRFLRIPEALAKFRVHEKSQSYAEPDESKSEEIVHILNRYFQTQKVPQKVMAERNTALSNANIVAARFHLRAERYRIALRRLLNAWRLNARCCFSLQTFRLLGNGLLYRLKKVFFR